MEMVIPFIHCEWAITQLV